MSERFNFQKINEDLEKMKNPESPKEESVAADEEWSKSDEEATKKFNEGGDFDSYVKDIQEGSGKNREKVDLIEKKEEISQKIKESQEKFKKGEISELDCLKEVGMLQEQLANLDKKEEMKQEEPEIKQDAEAVESPSVAQKTLEDFSDGEKQAPLENNEITGGKEASPEKEVVPEGVPFQKSEEEKVKEEKERKEIEEAVDLLFSLEKKRASLYPEFDKQRGLMYQLGIKKKDAQVAEEYTKAYDERDAQVKVVAELTGMSEDEVRRKYLSGQKESGEKKPEDEKKLKEVQDFINGERDTIKKEVENLEKGKKGAFEKLVALTKSRKFQIALGLALAGVAIAAPPTGFVSMLTFGMHPGFLPAVYVMETKVIEGFIGGALVAKGIYDNAEKLKEKGVNLVEGIKKKE